MTKCSDLTGRWDGTFGYPDVPEAGPITPFLAQITDNGGIIKGTVMEPNEWHPGTAHSVITGQRIGRAVHFAKDYRGAGDEYCKTVLYYGTMSADSETITGEWQIGHWRGPFEMTRELSAEPEAVEALEAVV